MSTTCPKCHSESSEIKPFCGDCGTPLTSSKNPRPEATATIHTPIKELTTGSTFAGRYQIIEEIGHGGMGRVYKVHDTDIKEKIALKLIRPEISLDKETVERFSNELKLARKIRHKNVCAMFDLGRAEGTVFLTMEYVAGEDLKRLTRRMGRFPTGKAVAIAAQISEGMAAAHELGIVHRDLKPSNIMVDEEGNARIMDFGIARALNEKGITASGIMIGTPEYMSPEQIEGKDVDERSDLYSLGIILYEMLAGRVPFEGETPLSIALKHKVDSPADPQTLNPQIPKSLSRLILRCLEKDKGKRYASAAELRADLDKIAPGLPEAAALTEASPATAVQVPSTRASREITVKLKPKKLVLSLAAVAILAVGSMLLLKFLPRPKAAARPAIENSIAVISFKNQTGDAAYDYLQEAIPSLLITNLENTGLFYVATWERMQDVLKQMGSRPARTIDSDLGFEICRREGIKAIAIGSFTKAGDVFRMDVKVLDTGVDKRLVCSSNKMGTGVNSILDSQIDALSREISLGLGVGKEKVEAARLSVKDITTPSLQAYEYFLKGKAAYNELFWEDAKGNMRRALEIDPSFAMAYVYLAWANQNTGDKKERDETIIKAMALVERTSQKDRLYLEAGYALFVADDLDKHEGLLTDLIRKFPDEKWACHYLGDFLWIFRNDLAGAKRQYQTWHKIDSRDPNALNHLLYVTIDMGDFSGAAEYIKMHDAISPPEAYNLYLQGILFERTGRLDAAIAKNKEALAIRPDFRTSFESLIVLYSKKGDATESMKWANDFISRAGSGGVKSRAMGLRGIILTWLGNFKAARKDFELSERMAEDAENWEIKASALEGKAVASAALGDFAGARRSLEDAGKVVMKRDFASREEWQCRLSWWLGMLSIEEGQPGLADARISEIRTFLPGSKRRKWPFAAILEDLLRGESALARGDLNAALPTAQRASGPESAYWNYSSVGSPVPYIDSRMDLLARIFAKKGVTDRAIAEYERLLGPAAQGNTAYRVQPLFHYRLGLLYQDRKDGAKASEQFRRFLDLWKDADPGHPEVVDARKRLEALK